MRRLLAIVSVALLAACSSSAKSSRPPGSSSPRASVTTAPSTVGRVATPTTTPSRGRLANAAWTTYGRDVARSGLAPDGPARAAVVQRRWSSPALDGDVYAQPLLVGQRVVVATENDTVYALRITDGSIAWSRHLGDPVSGSDLPCGNVDPVGITGTPVVDAHAQRVYVVGMVQPAQHMLFALDLASGAVVASTRVDAPGADPRVHNQRGALTLSNGRVIVPFGGRYGDCGDYRGRIVAVATTARGFAATQSYTLPAKREGGFWVPPGVAIAPDGSLFVTSGNSASRGAYDYGNSVLRLHPDLTLSDSFAVRDWAAANATDSDLGSTGPVLLPGGRVFQIGKPGVGYLLDAAHLGGIGGELFSAKVCDSQAYGAVAHAGSTLFVPCTDGVAQVLVANNRFTVGGVTSLSSPGPPVITTDAVWTVATGSGDLVALDRANGKTIATLHLGSVPSRFTAPAAGAGLVVAAADRTVFAYGD